MHWQTVLLGASVTSVRPRMALAKPSRICGAQRSGTCSSAVRETHRSTWTLFGGIWTPPPPPKKSEFSFRRLCRKFLTLLTNPCPNSAPNGVLRGLCGLIFQLSASRRAKTRSFDRATDWGVPTGGVSPYHPLNPHYIEPWATHTMNVVQYGVSYFFPQCSLMIRARGDTR